MPHPNTEPLRTVYETVSNGDMDTLMNALTDDIAWHVSGRSPVSGDYSGKNEVLGFFGKMFELYGGTLSVEVLDILAGDRHAAVLTRERATHAGTPLEFRAIHEFEIRDGKLARFTSFEDDTYNEYWAERRSELVS